ncbi:hypothetical protein T10_7956 [Trichinella papuae]|uniref:Uncharacterized protein n=1 Tax=Trichinella papuae TaxID=268474 RepID=A0A0V1MWA1_9BILA|nr:hypothetical protein T10_7956 [Trichinella papuae]
MNIGESKSTIIAEYKKKLMSKPSLFAKRNAAQSSSFTTSYKVALELAKEKKHFSGGMIIRKCAIKMAKQFNEPKLAQKFETVALSY